jgi:hypothetical protein
MTETANNRAACSFRSLQFALRSFADAIGLESRTERAAIGHSAQPMFMFQFDRICRHIPWHLL